MLLYIMCKYNIFSHKPNWNIFNFCLKTFKYTIKPKHKIWIPPATTKNIYGGILTTDGNFGCV